MKGCEICGSPVKPENLPRHLKKVHPGEKLKDHLSTQERKRIKTREGVSRREGVAVAAVSIAVIVIIILAIAYQSPGGSLVGQEAPSLSVQDVTTGISYALPSSFYGSVVFLEFFTPACGHCIDFVPTMQQLYDEYRSDVWFISIDVNPDDDDQDLEAFIGNHPGSDWVFSLDISNAAKAYGIEGTPHLFIIDIMENPSRAVVKYDHPGIDTYGNIADGLDIILHT